MSFRESEFEPVAEGLQYPEGPVWMADGSLAAVDVMAGTLLRFCPDAAHPGQWTQAPPIAVGGSANGAAVGPDGAMYICNSGGFSWTTLGPPTLTWTLNIPGGPAEDYAGGSIQRVSLADQSVETWCAPDSVAAPGIRGADDLVFDSAGGMWFTDYGKPEQTSRDITGVYYVPAGSRTPVLKMAMRESPNGIALSPKGDRVYVAETNPRWIHYWELNGPGSIQPNPHTLDGAYLLSGGFPGGGQPDSMKVDEEGNLYVATMIVHGLDPAQSGGITVFSPKGKVLEYIELNIGAPEPLPSNICFGGPDRRTAYITLAGTGRIVSCRMKVPGLKLAFGG
jgi:gluconolactonase